MKIGACPSAYKKKLDEAIVKAILDDLLIFKFDTFVKAEFILKYFNCNNTNLIHKFFSIKSYKIKGILSFIITISIFN